MAIQINCDRCKRFIKFASKKELNSMEDFILCKVCSETEAKLHKDIEQLRTRATNSFAQEANKYKELINEAVSKRLGEEK